MNKFLKIALMLVVGVGLAGCYNDFDNPGPARIYTDADFRPEQLISIKNLKDIFYAKYPGETGIGQSLPIEEDYVIRGKAISSDRAGNVYKSLYIYDESSESAIELRLTTGNYINYAPGRIVYVKLQGLILGNYRSMISVGGVSNNPEYANGNIESRNMLDEYILRGEMVGLTKADTLVVKKVRESGDDRYTIGYEELTDDALGRLIRFEGVTSKYGNAVNWSYNNPFPNYFANSTSYSAVSPDEYNKEGEVIWSWRDFIENDATWALARDVPNAEGTTVKTYYFGSFWFTFRYDDPDNNSLPGNYIVRSSGYSRFRSEEAPKDGDVVDLTAIYTKFSPGGGAYRTAYQLLLNSSDDVVKK